MTLIKERSGFILAVALYGTIGLLLRYSALPSEATAFYRGAIGAAFIFLYRLARGERPDFGPMRKNAFWLIVSGVGLGLNWIFLFAAYMNTTVAVASLCNYMAPVFVLALTPLVLREKIDIRKIPCIIAAFFGIVMVSGVLSGGINGGAGIAFGLAAACCFTGIVFCNRKLKGISAFDRALVQLAISSLTVLPYVIVKNGTLPLPDLRSGAIVLTLGIVHTGIAYCLYFNGMAALPVQSVAILGYLEPVVSVICSAIFLHETLGWTGWLGAVTVLAAAVISELIPEKEKAKTE